MPPSPNRPPGRRDDIIDWFTVSYKTIYSVAGIVLLVAAAVVYFFFLKRPPVQPTPTPDVAAQVSTARFNTLGEWVDATTETALRKGDLVRTGRDSAAEITFFDGTIVHVRPDSLITIEETSESPGTKERKVAWHISSGEVNLTARAATEVTTPTLRVRQEADTEGAIRVAETGESDVRIFRGAGSVETKSGQKVALASNEGVKVDSAGQAGSKVVLPPVPALLAPAHEADLVYPNPPMATTTLAWKDVAGAQGYRVLLDNNPQFYRPLLDQVRKGTSVQVRGLEAGKYYWKVAALDPHSVEGSFSEFARFAVSRPAAGAVIPPPPLTIEALDVRANILQIKGQTEGGASVTVNGQSVDVHSDGTFNEFITLEKLGKQDVKVRVVGLNGGTREETRSVVVAY